MPDKKNDTCSVHHLTKGADKDASHFLHVKLYIDMVTNLTKMVMLNEHFEKSDCTICEV